ncbi:hypothetical protein AALO_G00261560 [Alosa alosa]|uniref:Uncharacterized protein n=1 Tax=Alosa alosa TaxID=278164 RepID=A0AAV6FTQ7_9TELE|nr:hypothetical protein AALO_G00261560 [Alosa alosa]
MCILYADRQVTRSWVIRVDLTEGCVVLCLTAMFSGTCCWWLGLCFLLATPCCSLVTNPDYYTDSLRLPEEAPPSQSERPCPPAALGLLRPNGPRLKSPPRLTDKQAKQPGRAKRHPQVPILKITSLKATEATSLKILLTPLALVSREKTPS